MSKGMSFVLGLLCLGGGLFLLGQTVTVSNTGAYWGRWPSGLVALPLLVGIGMLFYNHKSRAWKIVTGFGVLFIVLSLVLSIRFTFRHITLFEFFLIFGFIAAGVAMLLRFRFGKE